MKKLLLAALLISCTQVSADMPEADGFVCAMALQNEYAMGRIWRCENKEAICYVHKSGGISCTLKDK